MSSVGIVGLGKLGLPAAITFARRGVKVVGYDRDSSRMDIAALSQLEQNEDLSGPLADVADLSSDQLDFAALDQVVAESDCILVAVETPHGPLHEGISRLPVERADFDYTALKSALADICAVAPAGLPIGVISTVLPGTINRELLPLVSDHPLVYCPQFIAMGSVAHDLCNPEFVLLGHRGDPPKIFHELFGTLSRAPVFEVSYETAELSKVIYNTYISSKVAVANLVQVMSHTTGADSRDVYSIMRASTDRIASPAYIGPGLGDGGPCHPRDNIALSWLLRELSFDGDLFTGVMQVREAYTDWLADLLLDHASGLPVVVLGTAYKPGTGIATGSSTVLLCNLLEERGIRYHVIHNGAELVGHDRGTPAAYFLGCPDEEFLELNPAPGSVIIDAWQKMPSWPGVETIHVGAPTD